MKDFFLSKLRNKNTTTSEFRENSSLLADLLAQKSLNFISSEREKINTPVGVALADKINFTPILVIILRSGMAMLPSFLKIYTESPVGVLGIYRDEKTLSAHIYYEKIPEIKPNQPIFILDPMLATGNSAIFCMQLLMRKGAQEENLHLFSFVGSLEGSNKLKEHFPKAKQEIAHIDPSLNPYSYIVPGLGDFGDRYFANIYF